MLRDGQVDAMMQTANNMTVFENAGFKFRFFDKPEELDKLFGAGYYVHERAISDSKMKDALGRYFRVVAKSVLFMKTNPEAAVRIHWKIKPDSKPTGQTEDKALANAMRDLATTAEYAGKPSSGKWGEYIADKMRAYIAFAGVSETLKDPQYLFTTAFVEAANSFKDEDIVAFAKSYVFK
jgi:NitT/TauT family transport system substrate-binding protein